MGQISVAILKRCAFRDSVQHFSNVYTYGSVAPNSEAYLEGDVIIDDIVTTEKKLHATSVTFVGAKMWSSGGTIAENTMLYEKALTGTGSSVADATLDRERALLFQWSAGKDSRGRPVYLRKWFHTLASAVAGVTISAAISNATIIPASSRTALEAIAGEFNSVGVAALWGLKAASGRERDTNGNPKCHPYLEHHQLGDEWRG